MQTSGGYVRGQMPKNTYVICEGSISKSAFQQVIRTEITLLFVCFDIYLLYDKNDALLTYKLIKFLSFKLLSYNLKGKIPGK